MNALIKNAIASGILSEDYHSRLIVGLEKYAREAGISKNFICQSMLEDKNCSEEEAEFYSTGVNPIGAVYSLCWDDIYGKMSAITAFFLRNFKNARLAPKSEVLDSSSGHADAHILLIPDFFIEDDNSKYKIADMTSLLYRRYSRGLFTVLYVSELSALSRVSPIPCQFLNKHYRFFYGKTKKKSASA